MKKLIKMVVLSLVLATITPLTIPVTSKVVEAAAVKINVESKSTYVGDSFTLKISGTKSKVTWSTSNKKVATVSSKGKVTAMKKGNVTITATVNKKKYTCKVTVGPKYKEGTYTIGKDLPHGEYVFFQTKGKDDFDYGIYEVDGANDGVAVMYTTISDFSKEIYKEEYGITITLMNCYAVPIKYATNVDTNKGYGMFKVGTHIEPGTYKIVSTDKENSSAWVSVYKDAKHFYDSNINSDDIIKYHDDGSLTVTVKKGQYIEFSHSKIAKKIK